jgi:hypothetical protein
MSRYREVDWRTHRNIQCNGGLNPQLEQLNDGHDANLFEVVFVKAKEFHYSHCLASYTCYFMGKDGLASNDFDFPRVQLPLQNERAALDRRVKHFNAVFNAGFNLHRNPDLVGAVDEKDHVRLISLSPTANQYGTSKCA